MKWIDKELNISELESLIGVKIKGMRGGGLQTGEFIDSVEPSGEIVQIPIIKKGIEIDFVEEPTEEQLNKLDLIIPFKREGGKTLISIVDELKVKIETQELQMEALEVLTIGVEEKSIA